MFFTHQMHQEKMKDKKKKKKNKKNKKHSSDSSDSEDEDKKKEKLKKVKTFLFCSFLKSSMFMWLNTPRFSYIHPGSRSRGQASETSRSDDAAGWEEEAVPQPEGGEGSNRRGARGLSHETLPARWSHGFLPRTVTSYLSLLVPLNFPKRLFSRNTTIIKNKQQIQIQTDSVENVPFLFVCLFSQTCHLQNLICGF